MAAVRQASTDIELLVRRIASEIGLRYRLRNRDLPGSPDLANRHGKWAIFVHGCFWHRHADCPLATMPKANQKFWREKFTANRKRDARVVRALRKRGYTVATIWGCETDRPNELRRKLRLILRS